MANSYYGNPDVNPQRKRSMSQSKSAYRERNSGANGTQREALKTALHNTAGHPAVTPDMLLVIRQICSEAHGRAQGPERSLVEFKLSLTDAANEVEIPLGPDRNKLLAGLVSTFIEELYRPSTKSVSKQRSFDRGDVSQASP